MKLYPSTAKVFMPEGKALGWVTSWSRRILPTPSGSGSLYNDAYKGSIAKKIAAFMKEEDGITYDDMAKHTAK